MDLEKMVASMPPGMQDKLRRIYRRVNPDGLRSEWYIKRNLRIRHGLDRPIRVAFVVQMPEIWDKQAAVFERMLKDDRFDPYILVAPAYDFAKKALLPGKNPDGEWYRERYGGSVLDYPADAFFPEYNKEADFTCVFYDRPYDNYLPDGLRTDAVMQAASICMINYCTTDWEMDDFEYYGFGRHVTIWFASNAVEAANFRKGHLQKSWRKAYDIGYPAFTYYREAASENEFRRFLWTPRWSTAEDGVGSTHFFDYMELLIEWFTAHPEMSLTVRPHPLMFDNFISKGIMSAEEVQALKDRFAAAGIRFDDNRMIRDTFRETDVLISDYSSVISLYLVTGKPVIFCPDEVPVTQEFETLKKGMYVTENGEMLERALEQMTRREDPLEKTRNEVVERSLLRKKHGVEHILEVLDRTFRW